MIDMFRMIAEARDVAPAREIGEPEPRLMRDGEQKPTGRKRRKARQESLRRRQVLQHLGGEDEIEAPAVRGIAEDVRLPESERRVARARLGDRRGPEIDAEIAVKRDAALCQAFEEKALAAAEIENAARRAGADRFCELVVKCAEAQALKRVAVLIFSPVPLGGVPPDGGLCDHAWCPLV